MAKIFDSQTRIVPTWLEAARYLDQSNRSAPNLVLEIIDPITLTTNDRNLISSIDLLLEKHKCMTIRTVASTIFPLGLSKRNIDSDQLYSEHKRLLTRGKTGWGTYFGRLIERKNSEGEIYNPLKLLISRLKSNNSSDRFYTSCYELGVAIPDKDLCLMAGDTEGDLPIFDASIDGKRWYGGPCLSHLSFKSVKEAGVTKLNMTATYRSHHYCTRALGNLIGLAQLMSFVARSSNQQVGTLTCISTHAELDVTVWGGVESAKIILATEL
jgi:hypothetical protein